MRLHIQITVSDSWHYFLYDFGITFCINEYLWSTTATTNNSPRHLKRTQLHRLYHPNLRDQICNPFWNKISHVYTSKIGFHFVTTIGLRLVTYNRLVRLPINSVTQWLNEITEVVFLERVYIFILCIKSDCSDLTLSWHCRYYCCNKSKMVVEYAYLPVLNFFQSNFREGMNEVTIITYWNFLMTKTLKMPKRMFWGIVDPNKAVPKK